jgi:hypothetical protein
LVNELAFLLLLLANQPGVGDLRHSGIAWPKSNV